MRYWKCTCCLSVLVTNPQDSAATYSCPQCLKSACLCGGYSEIDIEEFKSIAFVDEPKKPTENTPTGDVATCFACNSPLHSQESDVALDERLRRAGMMTLSEVFNSPMARFQVHAGVKDLDTFNQWLIMRRDEFTKQQALMTLADKVEGDMFEWTVAHSSSFREVFYNFEVAKAATDELIEGQRKMIQSLQLLIRSHTDLARIMGAMTVQQMYQDYKVLADHTKTNIQPIVG